MATAWPRRWTAGCWRPSWPTTWSKRAYPSATPTTSWARPCGLGLWIKYPWLGQQRQPSAPQAAALGRWRHAPDFPRAEAVSFLRQTIRAHPGEVILLATGPLTNVAALFAMDEAIPSLLKGLVLMCGMFI